MSINGKLKKNGGNKKNEVIFECGIIYACYYEYEWEVT
jgi:hypothetical protein